MLIYNYYLPFSISEKSKCKLWANMPTFRDLLVSNNCLNSYTIVEMFSENNTFFHMFMNYPLNVQLTSVFFFSWTFFFANFGSTACREKSCENSFIFGIGASSKSLHSGFKLEIIQVHIQFFQHFILSIFSYLPIWWIWSSWCVCFYNRIFQNNSCPIQRPHRYRWSYWLFT